MIGQNPKAEVAPFFVGRNRDKEISLVGGDHHEQIGESHAKFRVKKRHRALGQDDRRIQTELYKIPLARKLGKYSHKETVEKLSKTVSPYTLPKYCNYILSLSLSISRRKKYICIYALSVDNIADTCPRVLKNLVIFYISPRVEIYSLSCLPIKLSFACSFLASFASCYSRLNVLLTFKNITREIGIVDYDK